MAARRPLFVGLGVTFLVVLAPFIPVLLGRETAMYGDVNEAHVPFAREAWQAMRDGRSPFWSPAIFAGHNMLGAGQSAIFYPPNAIFGWLHPVTAFRWWLLFHVLLAAGGAFAWSLHRWRSIAGATVSGIAYGLNGFLVVHLVHMPLVAAAAWMPLVFLGADLVAQRWTFPRAALLGGSLAAIAFVGHAQGLWIVLMGLGLVTLVERTAVPDGLRACLRIGGATAIGLCLGAVQILPMYEFAQDSTRPFLTERLALGYKIDPRHMLSMVFPRIVGGPTGRAWGPTYDELANYFGITVVALAVIAVIGIGVRRRTVSMLCLIGFGLLTALGVHTPFAHLVYRFVPYADSFRGWPRNLLLANLAVATLAGAGVRHVMTSPRVWAKRLAIATAALLVFVMVLPVVTDLGDSIATGTNGIVARGAPLLLLAALAASFAVLNPRHRLGLALVLAVCALDVAAFAYWAPWRTNGLTPAQATAYYSSDPSAIGVPADAKGGIDRWVTDSRLLHSTSLVKEMTGVNGYDPLVQGDFALVAGGLVDNGEIGRPDFWEPGWLNDVLRVTTLVASSRIAPDESWHREERVARRYVRYSRSPRLADAYLVGEARLAAVDQMPAVLRAPDTDLRRTAYVKQPLPVQLSTPGPAGGVRSSAMLRGEGRWDVDAVRPALLVVSYAWLDGWHATVDGQPARTMRTDGIVTGIVVPPGRHRVALHFVPPGLRAGFMLTVFGLVALIVVSVAVRITRTTV